MKTFKTQYSLGQNQYCKSITMVNNILIRRNNSIKTQTIKTRKKKKRNHLLKQKERKNQLVIVVEVIIMSVNVTRKTR